MDQLVELALLVKAGQREFERAANEVMAPLGLTGAQADALSMIAIAGPLSLKELGGLLIAESGHPSRLVERLVDSGWVERSPVAGDRRSIELSLTEAGRRLEKRVQKSRTALIEGGHAVLGDVDIEDALAVLRDLARHSTYHELIERRRELTDGA